MTTRLKQVQPVLAFAAAHLDEDLSLAALADQAGLSAFHLHRVFSAAAGETPKQFTLRLRLGARGGDAADYRDSVLDVALSCGFQSHEAFCRAFRKRFGTTPSAYRARGFAGGEHQRTSSAGGPYRPVHQAFSHSTGSEDQGESKWRIQSRRKRFHRSR